MYHIFSNETVVQCWWRSETTVKFVFFIFRRIAKGQIATTKWLHLLFVVTNLFSF